jgi:hypothetical protein
MTATETTEANRKIIDDAIKVAEERRVTSREAAKQRTADNEVARKRLAEKLAGTGQTSIPLAPAPR